jgi:hypothetical protein
VDPPKDCAATTRPRRLPIARTTVSAYSASPAESSSHGRSGARVSWPRCRSSRSTRCQYHPTSPPPWISTKVATVISIPARSSSLTGWHQHAKRRTRPGQHRDQARAAQRGSTATSADMRRQAQRVARSASWDSHQKPSTVVQGRKTIDDCVTSASHIDLNRGNL